MSQQQLPFEPESLVRIIRGFITLDRAHLSEDIPSVELAGSLLWDLTADQDAVGLLLQSHLVDAVHSQLSVCSAHEARDGLCWIGVTVERVLELCFGILGNLYAFPQAVQELVAEEAGLLQMLDVFTTVDDPPALSEICRMLASALSSGKGRAAWLPLLCQQQHVLAHLMLLIQSTLHAQLLQRSLELVASLLHASTAAESADATEADTGRNILQLLWDAALAEALTAVLVPAASLAAVESAAAAVDDTAGGGWDDAAEPSGPEDGTSLKQQEQKLYTQPPVLEALVGILEQLAMEPGGTDAAVEHIPQLPQLMLQLLQTCSSAGQQDVLELLLPVLVEYRATVLPLLQQQEQPQPTDDGAGAVGEERRDTAEQERDEQPQQQQQQALQYLVYIAGVLRDCSSPDSLDALDAGWFLCAAATRGLWHQRYQQQEQQQASRAAPLLHISTYAGTSVKSCALIEQLCKSLSLARIPDTAVKYAQQCVANLVQKVAAVATGQLPHKLAIQHLKQAAEHLVAVVDALQQVPQEQQQQQQQGNEQGVVQQQLASAEQLQQDVKALQQQLESVMNS